MVSYPPAHPKAAAVRPALATSLLLLSMAAATAASAAAQVPDGAAEAVPPVRRWLPEGVLDEPYAALDAAGTATVTAALEAFDGTLVIAAPDLSAAPVREIVDL